MTTSKHSTESATNTKKSSEKSRWFRTARKNRDAPEFEHILDHYWGGSERRITGLTVRIISVNVIALIILLIGTLYLGQYQANLIEAKLETFKARIDLVSAAILEGAIEQYENPDRGIFEPPQTITQLSHGNARSMVKRLSGTMNQRIMLFDPSGELIIDSRKLTGPNGTIQISPLDPPDDTLYSIQVLKRMARFVARIFPDQKPLPLYREENSTQIKNFPDALRALNGTESISAWRDKNDEILLTAALPLVHKNELMGVLMLTKNGKDIEEDISEVWLNIIKAFFITSILTIMLSIYLSGVIARPLKKLARAAEGVRKGKLSVDDIPDMSARHDEIGELSIALREMTAALWERMDTIESFAADVAHELKNPLTSLRSAIETAAIVKKKSDQDKLMAIILHDVERMDRLISDISNASKLDSELSREALEHVNLKHLLNSLLDVYKTPLDREKEPATGWSNSVTINNNVTLLLSSNINESVSVWGLEGRLEQVFQNLISNALSFAPGKSQVRILVTERLRRVTITIEDEGRGIPDNKLETIFERFYSERPEHEDYGKHSGLGLSICKQIIAALEGDIFAENIKDTDDETTGAKFTIILNKVS